MLSDTAQRCLWQRLGFVWASGASASATMHRHRNQAKQMSIYIIAVLKRDS